MFKSELEIFVVKRISACLLLFLAITIIFSASRWYISAGLIAGAFLSIFKFVSYAWIFRKATNVSSDEKVNIKPAFRSIIVFSLNQIILLFSLLLSYFFNQWFFCGVVTGVLLAPFVLVINCFTEALGITKNNFFM